MALPDLATEADLLDRGVTVDADVAAVMLAAASSLVRSAAGSPIAETDSTVTLWAIDATEFLPLPGQPITAVSAVSLDGDAVTDFKVVNGHLWRRGGWNCDGGDPLAVEVTLTHGYAEVPAHITHLVVDLALAGITAAEQGAHDPRVVMERIDDYSVQFAQGAQVVASAMSVPPATRVALRRQFGNGAGVVGSLR